MKCHLANESHTCDLVHTWHTEAPTTYGKRVRAFDLLNINGFQFTRRLWVLAFQNCIQVQSSDFFGRTTTNFSLKNYTNDVEEDITFEFNFHFQLIWVTKIFLRCCCRIGFGNVIECSVKLEQLPIL